MTYKTQDVCYDALHRQERVPLFVTIKYYQKLSAGKQWEQVPFQSQRILCTLSELEKKGVRK